MSATARPNIHHATPPHKHSPAAAPHGLAAPALYQGRHPEQSLLYRTIAAHFETWLALAKYEKESPKKAKPKTKNTKNTKSQKPKAKSGVL